MKNSLAEKPKLIKDIVFSSGYSMNTATKQVPAVIEQKGVQEEIKKQELLLVDAMEKQGIGAEYIAERIGHLMAHTNYMAVNAGISHAVKIRGDYAPERSIHANVTIDIEGEADLLKFLPNIKKDARKEYEDAIDGS